MATETELHELSIPGGSDRNTQPDLGKPPSLAISSDASFAAVSMALVEGKGVVAAWDATKAKLIVESEVYATALAFSSPAPGQPTLLAAGFPDGKVRVWSLPSGKEVAQFSPTRVPVYALAFGRDPWRREDQAQSPLSGFLLGIGGGGGELSIWELGNRLPMVHLKGSPWDVFAVAFSPDSAVLASAGRDMVKVWDVAKGKSLLDIPGSNYATSLAFSPDGTRLACATPESVRVVTLEPRRGIQTLYGLDAPIAAVEISQDGCLLAALSQRWELSVWNLVENQLLHTFQVPVGTFADNTDMAFSPDGSWLAFASDQEAKLWDATSGKVLASWPLPPGLQNHLAFPAADRLLLLRVETEDRTRLPTRSAPADKHPRVVRVRDMLGKKAIRSLQEFKGFARGIIMCELSGDGDTCIVEGADNGGTRVIKAFATQTRKELWSVDSTRHWASAHAHVTDPAGKLVAIQTDSGPRATILELATKRFVRTTDVFPMSLGPEAELVTMASGPFVDIRSAKHDSPLIRLGIDQPPAFFPWKFSRSGTALAWGCADGTVCVADIPKVKRELKKLGLDR